MSAHTSNLASDDADPAEDRPCADGGATPVAGGEATWIPEPRELAERYAAESRRFDRVLSSILDFAYTFDLDGRFTFVNKPLLDLWGLTLDQAIGKNFFDLRYPDDLAARLQRQIQHVIHTRQRLVDETPYTSPTGAGGYYQYIFSPVIGPDGAVEAVAGSTRDITDRKQAEEALRQSEARLAAEARVLADLHELSTRLLMTPDLATAAQETLDAVLTLVGADMGTMQIFDPAARGLRFVAQRGFDAALLATFPVIGCEFHSTCGRALRAGERVIMEDVETDPAFASHRSTAAALGYRAAQSTPLMTRSGEILGMLTTHFRGPHRPSERELRSIDLYVRQAAHRMERARAEEAVRHARDAAEAASRAKDRFLAVLSHELRTPLSPVVMSLAAMEIDPDLPLKFREDVSMVRRNIDLEVKLIDDLLDLSRVISGKLSLQMQPVGVHELLRHAIHSSDGEISARRLHVRQDLGARNDRLRADPARLQQVFWNLLRNAVKFTPEGGAVTVRTWDDEQDGRLCVEVRDTGVGIEPDALPRIFDAFEQGDARITHQFGGLGLGLSIAKAVVEMHGGTISAASDGRDRGSTFTVRLDPISEGLAAETPSRGSEGGGQQVSGAWRVLLVEDHSDTARTLARLLKGSGYDVKTAHSVGAALQLAAAEPFDIVVSDIGLPDATGYDLMVQIRDRYGIKGIALSGYGMEEDVRKSREAGFVDHVVKPVNLDQLQAVIRRVTNGG